MIEIDKNKCVGCMKCIDVCPFTVIKNNEGAVKVEKKFCLNCFHCGGVCPENAITFNGEPTIIDSSSLVFGDEYNINLKELVMTRRSIRHFQDKKIEKRIIDEILETTKWVPSTKNERPAEWKIIDDENILENIMSTLLNNLRQSGKSKEVVSEFENGNNVVIGESKCVIITYSQGRHLNPSTDCIIAMTTAELLLQSQGIGTCWAGYLTRFMGDMPELKGIAGIPENATVYGSLMCGYPDREDYLHIPVR